MAYSRRLTVAAIGLGLLAAGALVSYALERGYAWTAIVACTAALCLILSLEGLLRQAVAPLEPPIAPALARLHRARQRLAALVDHAPDPLLAFDGKALRAVNRAARQMFDTDDILLAPPAALLEAAGSTAVSARRTVALDRRGVAVTFSVATVDIIEDDAMSRLMWLIDIQAELRAAESATLRQMLEVLGHEIMNALTPIASLSSTAADLLRDDTVTSRAQALDALGTLERRAQAVLTFTDGYRTMTRLPPPVIADAGLLAVISDLVTLFETQWRIEGVGLTLTQPATDILVRMDRDQIIQALWAILQNAAEATLVNPHADRSVRLIVTHNSATLSFTVEDNGPGFGEIADTEAFQPFFTTKAEGSGIGLSLAREIFRAHGGDVAIRPVAGRGAKIVATL